MCWHDCFEETGARLQPISSFFFLMKSLVDLDEPFGSSALAGPFAFAPKLP